MLSGNPLASHLSLLSPGTRDVATRHHTWHWCGFAPFLTEVLRSQNRFFLSFFWDTLLKLTVWSRLASNRRSTCFCLLSAGLKVWATTPDYKADIYLRWLCGASLLCSPQSVYPLITHPVSVSTLFTSTDSLNSGQTLTTVPLSPYGNKSQSMYPLSSTCYSSVCLPTCPFSRVQWAGVSSRPAWSRVPG